MRSALYTGIVTHLRRRPRRHDLRYRVMQGLFDLDELPTLGGKLRLFGYNRAAPISFHDKDHGDGSGELRGWVEAQLRSAGFTGDWGAVRVLCMPRMLGFVFNPIHNVQAGVPVENLLALYDAVRTFRTRPEE